MLSGYLVSLSALLAALPLRVKRTREGRIVFGLRKRCMANCDAERASLTPIRRVKNRNGPQRCTMLQLIRSQVYNVEQKLPLG
jgi:hypothetical protein